MKIIKKGIICVLIFILLGVNYATGVGNITDYEHNCSDQTSTSSSSFSTDWWPMFHHDIGLTGFSTSTTPLSNKVTWDAWSDNFWAPQRSSPAIVNDTIFIGVVDPQVQKSAQNFKELKVEENHPLLDGPLDFYFKQNKMFSPEVERWYEAYLLCMNATSGVEKWHTRLTDEYYISGSVAVSDDKAYITTTVSFSSPYGHLFCLDAKTGTILWVFPLNGNEYLSPVVLNGKVYISGWIAGDNSSKICRHYCLDAGTGVEIFNTTLGVGEPIESAAIYDNRVYISVWDDNCNETYLYCMNAENGMICWSKNLLGNFFGSCPVVYNDTVIVSSTFWHGADYSCDGILWCLNAETGAVLWNYTTNNVMNGWSTPAVAYGNVYFASSTIWYGPYVLEGLGEMRCLNATTGELIWNKTLNKWLYSSPVVADGKIYIDSMDYFSIEGYLYCLDASNGEILWQYWLVEGTLSSPALANGRLYLATFLNFYAFDDSAPPNNPPTVTLTGPQWLVPGKEYNYTLLAEDPEGYDMDIFLELSWSSGYAGGIIPSGVPIDVPMTYEDGEYWMRTRVRDSGHACSNWSLITINVSENYKPMTPTITGPLNGKIGKTYDYTLLSATPNEDNIWYFIDWGDGTNSSWVGPHPSAEEIIVSHKWSEKGTYSIKVKAKDTYDTESDWGTLEVNMPKSMPIPSLFPYLFERFPNAFPILWYLFKCF